jgi:hypothetical protein
MIVGTCGAILSVTVVSVRHGSSVAGPRSGNVTDGEDDRGRSLFIGHGHRNDARTAGVYNCL